MDLAEEHKILTGHLAAAFDEASKKTRDAQKLDGKSSKEQEMAVWLAMESVEYTSLLFALTHDFEDVDPPSPSTKGLDSHSLIKESVEAFERARSSDGRDRLADYTLIRDAVLYLRRAYLELTRARRRRQNLTRSKPGRTPSQGAPRVSIGHMSRRRSRSSPIPQRTHPGSTA